MLIIVCANQSFRDVKCPFKTIFSYGEILSSMLSLG